MSETTCPECGERNVGRPEFCASCGAFLAWDTDDAAPPAQPPTAPMAPAGQPAPPAARTAPIAPSHPIAAGAPASVPTAPGAAVAGGAPAWARSGGQPAWMGAGAAAPTAWQEAAPPPPPEPPPPVDQVCPTCGVENDPSLRFCRKCGHAFAGPVLTDSGPAFVAAPEKIPWWRRWHRPAPGTSRAARVAYRQSMPLLYRAKRYIWAALGIGAIVGTLAFIGQNPIGWVTARWQDLRGEVTQVEGVDAVTEPSEGASAEFPAGNLVDNLSDTAWATTFTVDNLAAAANAACVAPSATSPPGVPASAVLIPTSPVTLRSISVAAGLPEGDQRRLRQWRPKTLQLGFSDGSCQRLGLGDTSALQELELEPVETAEIRVSVVDAYPPVPDQPFDLAAISEIRLFSRP